MIELVDSTLSANPDLATMFETAAKFNATCVQQSTLNDWAIYICGIGICMGIVFTLVYQYTQRKGQEYIARAEAEKAKDINATAVKNSEEDFEEDPEE